MIKLHERERGPLISGNTPKNGVGLGENKIFSALVLRGFVAINLVNQSKLKSNTMWSPAKYHDVVIRG